MKNALKKTAAGLLALALVAGALPRNTSTGEFLKDTAITANAAVEE